LRFVPMHPVIVGYDGSASARNALAYASGLARNLSRPLLVMHVASTPNYAGPLSIGWADVFDPEASERWLRSELADVTDHSGVDVHIRARSGSPARQLAAAVAEFRADALVIGASAPFRRYFAGSVPAWLVRRARCPVIVVP
jgi:nucleotide-binding universal stress UspA family protein